ncbi:MAG: adenosylmethionine decarboxylase [Phycisphaerae bacterium]
MHCIAELFDCPAHLLNDRDHIEQAVRDAVECGDATLLNQISFKFTPQGVTALGLISESHLSIHTWPECGYAAVDTFTCGHRANAENAVLSLVKSLGAKRYHLRKLDRGQHFANDASVCTVEHDVPPEQTPTQGSSPEVVPAGTTA